MNKHHMYVVAASLLISSWGYAMHRGQHVEGLMHMQREDIFEDNYEEQIYKAMPIAVEYELVPQPLALAQPITFDRNLNSLAIYVLSRHNTLQALATRCSGKYSLSPDNIALLFSTLLVDGGVNAYNEVQEYRRQATDFYTKSTEESLRYYEAPRKSDVAKDIALSTVTDCSKTLVAIGLQKGTTYMMKNYGFDQYVRDLSKSKLLSKTLAFVLSRGVASYAVESAIEWADKKF